MCNTPNTDPFGNVIRDCYCEAQDIAACLKQENDRLKVEIERLRMGFYAMERFCKSARGK